MMCDVAMWRGVIFYSRFLRFGYLRRAKIMPCVNTSWGVVVYHRYQLDCQMLER